MKLIISLTLLAALFSASANSPFFNSVEIVGGASPPATIKNIYDVTLNLDDLELGTEDIVITLPNNDVILLNTENFYPIGGYEFSDEEEIAAGAPPFYILPDATREDLTYQWRQTTDNYDVVITVNKAVIYGYINGNEDRYIVKNKFGIQQYVMNEMNLAEFPDEDRSAPETLNPDHTQPSNNEVEISGLKYFTVENQQHQLNNTFTQLDMLILYDEDARANENTDPNDPNSTVGIETLIMEAVAHTNSALSNSLSNTRVVGFYMAKVIGTIANNSNVLDDLLNLRLNQDVIDIRNQVGADVVSVIIGINPLDWGACGYSFVQTHSQCGVTNNAVPGCGVGSDFVDYAFNMVTNYCAISDDTFTHELGHLMGANHSRSDFQFNFAWLQDVVANGYPEAFGYQQSTFYSIMSIQSVSTRRLFYSNPAVTVDGGIPTGVSGTRHNQFTIDALSPTMENYRHRPDLIFVDGFE